MIVAASEALKGGGDILVSTRGLTPKEAASKTNLELVQIIQAQIWQLATAFDGIMSITDVQTGSHCSQGPESLIQPQVTVCLDELASRP